MKIAVILLLASVAAYGNDGKEEVVWVPEGYKVALVPAHAPARCIGLRFIELIMPGAELEESDCESGGLVVSPGCD